MHTNKTQKTKYAFTVLNTILSLFVLLYASTAFAQVDDEDSTMYKYGALEAKIFSINDEVNDLNDDLDTNIILAEEGINELDDLIQEQKKMKELSEYSRY